MTRFVQSLLDAGTPVIAEIKPRTGDGDDLLRGRAPADLARAYAEAGAACLSVVTGRWFGGSLELLGTVAARTGLPVLRKDFLTRPGQLEESAAAGASAVLLTAQLLPAGTLRRLVEHALRLGLTPFVEVTGEAEILDVPHPADCVIAVNNKDIRVRERTPADLGRSVRLLPTLLATGTPCPVSASGIDTPAHGAGLLAAGYAGLLVGTALLRADGPAGWFAGLRQESEVAP
jgi:indole-3-glycerol phosphate synthase